MDQPTAFFSKTYDEAMALLVEARDYIARREPVDRARLEDGARLRLCSETMRLTARLTQIMAWLLAQRAVHAGEIGTADIVADWEPLATVAVCMEDERGAASGLPAALVDLLERSRRLYVRVARLDEMIRRAPHDRAAPGGD